MHYQLSLGTIACLLLSAGVSKAQNPADLLPPPPANAPLPTIPLPSSESSSEPPSSTPLPGSPAPMQDTVFQAPTIDQQRPPSERYWVYVNGDSPYLLQQVQIVEAQAFIRQYQGRRVIQVGTFNDAANARRQVTLLNQQGIRAEVASGTLGFPTPATARYAVVVPGSRDELTNLAAEAIRLGIRQDAVQQKEAPIGPHIEIGPFADRKAAEDVNRLLRHGGMDSRVYYKR